MTKGLEPAFAFEIDQISTFKFDDLELKMEFPYLYGKHQTLGFSYRVYVNNKEVGVYTALITDDFLNKLPAEGNMGLDITDKSYYGTDVPFKSTKAILGLYRHFKQEKVLITTENENGSVHQMCKSLGGAQIDSFQSKEGKVMVRYEVDVL